uniref:Potassium channel toxin alpha-KTx 19.2 n=1 Tax=Buthus occitanus tunetanus TaxID=6871 RepID=KA192_BUTOC|nr:RecName: Full=Potassium channel toxin alpha-KTx 19.2; AltName: Full=Toxin Kbot21 [Buthus occitanus tunetanus]
AACYSSDCRVKCRAMGFSSGKCIDSKCKCYK